jgi:hypothetical protein
MMIYRPCVLIDAQLSGGGQERGLRNSKPSLYLGHDPMPFWFFELFCLTTVPPSSCVPKMQAACALLRRRCQAVVRSVVLPTPPREYVLPSSLSHLTTVPLSL